MKEDNCRFYILFVLLILFFQDSVDQFFVDRKEMSCHWSYAECADDGSDAYGAAKDKANDHKGQIYDDSYDAEFLFCLIADDNGYQIVWAGSGIRLDNDGHSVGEDDASKSQHQNLKEKGIRNFKQWSKDYGENVDDRPSKNHTKNGSNLYIAFIHHQQCKDDKKTDYDMYSSVGDQGPV